MDLWCYVLSIAAGVEEITSKIKVHAPGDAQDLSVPVQKVHIVVDSYLMVELGIVGG